MPEKKYYIGKESGRMRGSLKGRELGNSRRRKRRLERLWRRYIKAAARRKNREYRAFRAAFFLCVFWYLAAAGHLKERLVRICEESAVEWRKGSGDGKEQGFWEEIYRITFRLKDGEIVIFHEKTGGEGTEHIWEPSDGNSLSGNP